MSNIITLDNIKEMNLDEIVNLYRQGYILENTDDTYVESIQEPPDGIAHEDTITHTDILLMFGVSLFSIYTVWQILTSK